MFDVIERLKSEWTDRYVVVDAAVPELARFSRTTGFVRTVNMNGRCLVEFDQFNNVGWYDIDPSYLTIVEKPLPKPAAEAAPKEKAPAAKPAAKAAAATPAAKAGGRPSTADILAAARKAAAPKPAAEKPAAKPGGRPSTADILAMARGKAAAAAAPPAVEPSAVEPPTAVEPAREAEEPPAAEVAAPAADIAKPAAGPLPTTTAEKIAWCRAHDGAGG